MNVLCYTLEVLLGFLKDPESHAPEQIRAFAEEVEERVQGMVDSTWMNVPVEHDLPGSGVAAETKLYDAVDLIDEYMETAKERVASLSYAVRDAKALLEVVGDYEGLEEYAHKRFSKARMDELINLLAAADIAKEHAEALLEELGEDAETLLKALKPDSDT